MKELIASQEQIQEVCKKLGKQITEDLKGEDKVPVILGVMKGALNFMMDLCKYIECPVYTDFIRVSSMAGIKSSGKVTLLNDLTVDVKDRLIIIVEDIIDTGISMDYLIDHINDKFQPKEVRVCALIDKPANRRMEIPVRYTGFKLDKDAFLIGYGLDYNEFDRNVPYIYVPTTEEIDHFDDLTKNH